MTEDSPKTPTFPLGDLGGYPELYPSITRRLKEALTSARPEIRKRLLALQSADTARRARRLDKLSRDFGLTATEARLAVHLADGGTVAGYADHFGVSVGTVRSQVKAIFAKTGVNRQAALAAIVPRA